MSSSDQVQRQNIESWHKQLVKWCGLDPSSLRLVFLQRKLCLCFVFHERIKHIEVDCHFVRNTVMDGLIITSFTTSFTQLTDVFTKTVAVGQFKSLCNKLGIVDLYAPTWGGVLELLDKLDGLVVIWISIIICGFSKLLYICT